MWPPASQVLGQQDLSPKVSVTTSQTAQEAETRVHLNQPRPGSHAQTSSSQLTDVRMRRRCLWSWALSSGRFVKQHH